MVFVNDTELLPEYDYIIAGAGCAGLSLVHEMIRSGHAAGMKILLVDQSRKEANDRTWCFWEKEPGPFEAIVYRSWDQLAVIGEDSERRFTIAPYRYKLIRGEDFYRFCFEAAAPFSDIHFLQEAVSEFIATDTTTAIRVGSCTISCRFLFNSIYTMPALGRGEHWLLQHFKGRLIQTDRPAFNPEEATLMDFRTGQEAGTSFVYVLPFSDREALVEYTLFSPALLEPGAYDRALDSYIGKYLDIAGYRVLSEEFGVIPMTNFRFPIRRNSMVYLGTAGGQTKGSSGYTFQNIQRHSRALVQSLEMQGHPFATKPAPKRFHFYDSVLLDILHNRTLEGAEIFTTLFRKNDPGRLLRFLDNQSTLREDLGIIASLPTLPFARAAMRQIRF